MSQETIDLMHNLIPNILRIASPDYQPLTVEIEEETPND